MKQQQKKLTTIHGEQPKLKGKEKIMNYVMQTMTTIVIHLLGNHTENIDDVVHIIAEEQNIDYISYQSYYSETVDVTEIKFAVRTQHKLVEAEI